MLQIIPIPALKDNYIWLIVDASSQQCLIVDPGAAQPVLSALTQQKLQPIGILLTHHHYDHTDGVAEIVAHYAELPVYGAAQENIATVTQPLHDNDVLDFPTLSLALRVLAIPGHTLGHVAYYGNDLLFCGDTLFTVACGRVFEGTMPQMYASLQRLANLPPETLVYCGHEYTANNLPFALAVEPQNVQLQQRKVETLRLREQGLPTLPSTIALELATNPFLRCEEESVRLAAEQRGGVRLGSAEEVFAVLREWKDNFRG